MLDMPASWHLEIFISDEHTCLDFEFVALCGVSNNPSSRLSTLGNAPYAYTHAWTALHLCRV